MELLWKVTCFQIRRYRELYRFARPCKSSARISFTVESFTSCAKGDCKSERRRYFHQLMSQSSWLINETILHRHHSPANCHGANAKAAEMAVLQSSPSGITVNRSH